MVDDLSDPELIVDYEVTLDGDVNHHRHCFGIDGNVWAGAPLTVGLHLFLEQTPEAHDTMITRRGLGMAALRATRASVDASGPKLLPPPLNAIESDWGRDLPPMRRWHSLVVQEYWTGTPFGDIPHFMRINDGRVTRHQLGESDDASVFVRRPYADVLAEHAGLVFGLDSFERADVRGDAALLMQFTGWFESDECTAARRRLAAPCDAALAVLGQILSSPAWTALVKDNEPMGHER